MCISRRVRWLGLAALVFWLTMAGLAGCSGKGVSQPKTRNNSVDGAAYVFVPAGEFTMGSKAAEADAAFALCKKVFGDDSCSRFEFEAEQPQHTVYLDEFWIMRTEVTNKMYGQCVAAGACKAPWNNEWKNNALAEYPVTDVDWDQAAMYARWTGGRLPTEAEWEKAARGTDGRAYPWGNDAPDGTRLNYCDKSCASAALYRSKDADANDGYAGPAPVGLYPAGASPYGALDMAGNVWEWVADWYSADYYTNLQNRNPSGPSEGEDHVLRGGGFISPASFGRSAYRGHDSNTHVQHLGFRVVNSNP